MQRPLILFSFALAAVTLACGSDTTNPPVSKIVRFEGNLSGTNENPPNTSQGTGHFVITLDTSTNVMTWNVTVTGLTSNITLGHIHGPAAVGANASPLLNFDPAINQIPGTTFTGRTTAPNGSATGTLTLTAATAITATVKGDSLKKLLLAGLTYVNIHTTQIGGGEVRAQVVKTP